MYIFEISIFLILWVNVYLLDFFSYSEKQKKNQSCKAYPGVDIDGDHNLIITKCGLKFKKINKSSKKYYKQNLKK